MEWKNNPTEIEYMIPGSEKAQKSSVKNVKEFGIGNDVKFISALVKIDRSIEEINGMSSQAKPDFHEEQLFLRVILEGNASLYSYVDGNLVRFFYKMVDAEIKQLVFKSYLIENNNNFSIKDKKIGQNMSFRQQLLNDLKCETINRREFEILNYNKTDLKKIFLKYNESLNILSTVYEGKKKEDWFNLSLTPGLNYGSANFENTYVKGSYLDFEKMFSFRFGIETQFILPFNKSKWSILFEPAYQYYNSDAISATDRIPGLELHSKINYQSIQLASGVGHSFFLKNKSKIFVNAFYVHDFSFNSSIEQKRGDGTALSTLDIKPRDCFALGAGYQFKNRFGIEMRYYTRRDLLGDYVYWVADFKLFSVILKYTLF